MATVFLTAAEAFAQDERRIIISISDRKLAVSSAVRAWAEKDAIAAQAWVLQMPAGQERDRALQSVVSSLAESDPQAALNMLQTLPTTGGAGLGGAVHPSTRRASRIAGWAVGNDRATCRSWAG